MTNSYIPFKVFAIEVWQKHPIYTEYEASNFGRIKKVNQILKQTLAESGYLIIGINKATKIAHRFIWECWNGIIPEGMCIDHSNTNRTDNSLSNLRLCTHRENSNNPLTMQHLEQSVLKKKSHHILQFEKGTKNIIAWYPSLKEAERQTKYSTNYLKKYCEGTQKCRKYDWELTDKQYTKKWNKWWETGDWDDEENE